MRKPTMTLRFDFKGIVRSRRNKKVTKLINYIIQKQNIKNFNAEHLTNEFEEVKNYSVEMLTFRYKGEIWLQEFPLGLANEGYRYKSPFID